MRAGNHCGHMVWTQTLGTSNLGEIFELNEISDMLNGK